jgi:hypothetical protein
MGESAKLYGLAAPGSRLLALFETQKRPRKLAVVGRHRDNAIRSKFDGFNRDSKLVIRFFGTFRKRLLDSGLLAKGCSGRE